MKSAFLSFLLFTAMALVASPVSAEPPVVGAKAPDFVLSTTEGKEVRLSELTSKGSIVLVVLRGYPGYQCPFCNRQVRDFTQKSSSFAQIGVRVVMVYPGPPQDLGAHAGEFMADKNFPENFDMLLDPGYKFTNLYGLRWDAPNETAYPSTFLIDREGVVFFAKISREHGGRTTAVEVLDALKISKAVDGMKRLPQDEGRSSRKTQ